MYILSFLQFRTPPLRSRHCQRRGKRTLYETSTNLHDLKSRIEKSNLNPEAKAIGRSNFISLFSTLHQREIVSKGEPQRGKKHRTGSPED